MKYEQQIRTRVIDLEPLVYFLDVAPIVINERSPYFKDPFDRTIAITFFSKVRQEFMRVFELLEINPIVIDASESLDTVIATILRKEELHCNVSVKLTPSSQHSRDVT